MYENTGPRAHLMAAELIEAGVDVADVYRRLYEEMPPEKLALMALALGQLQRFDDGELTLSSLSAEDFDRTEAEDHYSEGIIDQLRALHGTKVAVLVRELRSARRKGQRQSVVPRRRRREWTSRSSPGRRGGGGHRRAAGFTTALELDGADRLPAPGDRRAAARERRRSRDRDARLGPGRSRPDESRGEIGDPRMEGVGAIDKPRNEPRTTWSRRSAARSEAVAPATRARSTRSPPACCWCSWAGRPNRSRR